MDIKARRFQRLTCGVRSNLLISKSNTQKISSKKSFFLPVPRPEKDSKLFEKEILVSQAKMSSSDLKATFPNPDAAGYVGFANLPNQVSFSKAMILLISFLIFTMCLT